MSRCHVCGAPHLHYGDGPDGWEFDELVLAMVCPDCIARGES